MSPAAKKAKPEGLRVVRLTTTNVKVLRAVDITPKGDVVIVSGRNGQGKTTVIDSIWMALQWAAVAKETPMPIHEGEEKASVVLDLGELVVTRRWTLKGTTLEVSGKQGDQVVKYASPQAVLDAFVGKLTFDPLAFAQQGARAQLETLLSVVSLPFDPAELAERRKKAFDDRTEEHRNAKLYAAQIDGYTAEAVPEGTPDEEVSAGALTMELQEGHRLNGIRLAWENEATRLARVVKEAEEALQVAKDTLAAVRVDAKAHSERAVPDPVDTAGIAAQLAAVDETNKHVRDKQRLAGLVAKHDDHVKRGLELTSELVAIDAEKAEGLAGAKMPLEGLSFDDDGVIYNGVPFSQASASEQLRVGVALAMALNPKIRVIRIADGSLLDSTSMGMVEQLAKDNGFQVWVERVDESGSVGIVIEDGSVAA